MQTHPAVSCLPRLGDRGPLRSRHSLLLLISLILPALVLGFGTRAARAQVASQPRPRQSAERPVVQPAVQPAGQPPSPDTAQTKISQPPAAATPTGTAAGGTATIVLTPIRDEQGVMAAAVPAAWNQMAQGEWRIAGAPAGRLLSASPNQGSFATDWGIPGIALYYSTSLPAAMEPEDLLGVFNYTAMCQDGGRGTLEPGQRSVTYQIWQNCGGTGTAAAVLVIAPASRAYYAVVEVYLTSVDDLRALGPILSSVQFGAPDAVPPGAGGSVGAPVGGPIPGATLPPPTVMPTVVPTPAPLPTPVPILATVITDRLNLRSGPSTAVPRLTVVTRGMQLTVTGQTGSCAWLQVTAPDGQRGWVSGDPQFVTLSAACGEIPAVSQ